MEPTETLYPFGCLVLFLLEDDQHPGGWERRARGALVGFTEQRALKVLEMEPLRAEGRYVIRVTRDVRVDTKIFPLREVPGLVRLSASGWVFKVAGDVRQAETDEERIERLRRVGCTAAAGAPLSVEMAEPWFDNCSQRMDALQTVEARLTAELQQQCQ